MVGPIHEKKAFVEWVTLHDGIDPKENKNSTNSVIFFKNNVFLNQGKYIMR